jgi:hypothetical protein
MIRRTVIAIALAVGVSALAMPALQPVLAPHGWGSSHTSAVLADDQNSWDDGDQWSDDEWDDGGYYDNTPGPWMTVCGGYDTGIPFLAVGGCTPSLVGTP